MDGALCGVVLLLFWLLDEGDMRWECIVWSAVGSLGHFFDICGVVVEEDIEMDFEPFSSFTARNEEKHVMLELTC